MYIKNIGFGDSQNTTPSERGLQIDALTAYSYLLQYVPSHKIIIVGHSLGSGVASFLARNVTSSQIAESNSTSSKLGGLILMSGYTSIFEAAMEYPWVPLLKPLSWFLNSSWILEILKSLVKDKWATTEDLRMLDPDVPVCKSSNKQPVQYFLPFFFPSSYGMLLFAVVSLTMDCF
jgi:pimeloyl-ACP methyl ester carboxylesterase